MKKIECFKIQLMVSENPLDLKNGKAIKTILNDGPLSPLEPLIIKADPFLLVHGDALYLYYEDKKMDHNGVIAMTFTRDLVSWTKPVVVLQEKCHLSYPYIFEDNGNIYMIPETCEYSAVRLYKANHTLDKFEFEKTLITDIERTVGFSFSDTSIHLINGIYYLFTTINNGSCNILRLFISDVLTGPYEEHKMSPISMNNKIGRNGGGIVNYNSKLYRIAQDCTNGYGNNINLLEVITISKVKYEEMIIKENILPQVNRFYKMGGHQLNFTKFLGKYIIATDAKEYHYFFLYKIFRKAKKIFKGK